MWEKSIEVSNRVPCEKYAESLKAKGFTAEVEATSNGFVVKYQKETALDKTNKEFKDKRRRRA